MLIIPFQLRKKLPNEIWDLVSIILFQNTSWKLSCLLEFPEKSPFYEETEMGTDYFLWDYDEDTFYQCLSMRYSHLKVVWYYKVVNDQKIWKEPTIEWNVTNTWHDY